MTSDSTFSVSLTDDGESIGIDVPDGLVVSLIPAPTMWPVR